MRRWVRVALAVAAFAAVYVGLALLADLRAIRATLAAFPARAFVLALALVLAGYTLRALRWRLYLHRLGVLAPDAQTRIGFGTALATGLAPGKTGQVVKAYYLHLAAGLPYRVSVPATFGERIAESVATALLLLVGLALAPRLDALPALAAGVALVALLLAARSTRAARVVASLLARWRWSARYETPFLAAHGNLRGHLTLAELAAPALLGLVAFLFETLALVVLAEALGVRLAFGAAALTIALANLAGMIAIIPGGIGVAEGGLVVALTLQGAPLAEAAALTLLFRVTTLWQGVALGAACALALQKMHGHRKARIEPHPSA